MKWGGGGPVIFHGSLDLNFVRSGGGGGVIQNLDDGSKFQPGPPDT